MTVRQRAGAAQDTATSAMIGGTNAGAFDTTGNPYVATLTITDTLASGDAVTISINRAGGSDLMVFYAVEFVYTVKQ